MTSFYINNGKILATVDTVSSRLKKSLPSHSENQGESSLSHQLDRQDMRIDTSGTISSHFKELSFQHCSYNKILDFLLAATTIQQQQGNFSNKFERKGTIFQRADIVSRKCYKAS